MSKEISTTVNEGSSCQLEFQLVDFDDIGVTSTNIDTAAMTLYDKNGGTIINSRQDVNVKSYFTGAGQFSMLLDPADNPIVNASTSPHELHHALFTIEVSQGEDTITLTEELVIKVLNLKFVT